MAVILSDEQVSKLRKCELRIDLINFNDDGNIKNLADRASSQELVDYLIENLAACRTAALSTYSLYEIATSNEVSLEVVKLVLVNIDRIIATREAVNHVLLDARNPAVVKAWIDNVELFAHASNGIDSKNLIAINLKTPEEVNELAKAAKVLVDACDAYESSYRGFVYPPQPETAEAGEVEEAVEKVQQEIK